MGFQEGLTRYLNSAQRQTLQKAHIGIAGLGGLGSNIALMLARSGIGNFTLLDFDVVDWSNLNRQQYWPRHIGRKKTDALAELLHELNECIIVKCINMKLTSENVKELTKGCEIWIEALDKPETKAMFVNGVLPASSLVISASGICGIGGEPLCRSKIGKLHVIGDKKTADTAHNPYAPRVTQAAALMADCALEHLLRMQPAIS